MKRTSFRFALTAGLAALFLAFLAVHPALASGPVVGWGDDGSGQATPPSSVDGTTGAATAIAAGGGSATMCGWGGCHHWGHSCAIQAGTGAVVCWGDDSYGQATPPPSVDGTVGTATAIAASSWHSCAIQAGTGAVVCWGDDSYGEATPPPSVDGTTGTATAIAVGWGHSCAIQAGTDAVVCWGWDSFGQSTPPPSVDGTTGTATAIAVGWGHSCAVQAGTDAVVCWGWDSSGQSTPPPSVDGTTETATAIAAGDKHSCAIQAGTGAVVCWGNDSFGQATPPPSVDGTTGTASAIAAGGGFSDLRLWGHSCAIQAGTDAVVCWGSTEPPPPSVDGTTGTATAIAAGYDHTLAIRTPACDDGLDNDGDGLVDFVGGDPGCTGDSDLSERDPTLACDDGLDNDGDGFTDFGGGDFGCANPEDSSENDPTLPCDDGIDNDGDGSTDFPTDPGCDDLLDTTEAPNPIQTEVKLKIRLKFNKPSKDKILVKIKDWQLPAGVVPTDVTVNVGGAECSGTLDAEGKYNSPDGKDSILLKQSKKTQLWSIAVKRKNSDFAADLWDEGCTDADNPTPGLPVTVPLIINVGGVAYGQDMDLVYKSKLGKKGTAK